MRIFGIAEIMHKQGITISIRSSAGDGLSQQKSFLISCFIMAGTLILRGRWKRERARATRGSAVRSNSGDFATFLANLNDFSERIRQLQLDWNFEFRIFHRKSIKMKQGTRFNCIFKEINGFSINLTFYRWLLSAAVHSLHAVEIAFLNSEVANFNHHFSYFHIEAIK